MAASPRPARVAIAPVPTLAPRPEQAPGANLLVLDRADWAGPVVVSPSEKAYLAVAPVSVDDVPYISFRVFNSGAVAVERRFFVDLYFDQYLAYRFAARSDLAAGYFLEWPDWPDLTRFVRLTPGDHTLRVVVDSTDLISETDETDNVFEQVFHWDEAGVRAKATDGQDACSLPNLVPFAPRGWEQALQVTSYPASNVNGPLSVDVPTFFRYGFTSEGPVSIPTTVLVDIYVDGMLVLRDPWTQLLAEQRIVRDPWIGMHEVLDLEPGTHLVKLVIDPTNLVSESNEDDNVYEIELDWSTGAVLVPLADADPLTALAEAPTVLTRPNLVPGWIWKWDGPIITSHYKNIWIDGPLTVQEPAFVDVVVFNESTVDVESSFSLDLYFDDRWVHRFDLSPGTPGRTFKILGDWPDLGRVVDISPGAHTLKIVIDPQNAVEEANEGDNVYEKTYVWDNGGLSQTLAVSHTDADLREMLSDISALVDTREPALSPGGKDYRPDILRTVEAGYYLLTGRSIRDERVNIHLLGGDDYLAWIADSYRQQLAVAEESEYPAILAGRARDMSVSSGYKSRRFGKVAVVVNTDPFVADVISAVIHELGHALQDFMNPAQTEAGEFFQLRSIREAEAQQFERAFWLTVEKFTGTDLLSYPAYDVYRRLIDTRLDEWVRNRRVSEHAVGHLLQWLVPLDDSSAAQLGDLLRREGKLGPGGSKLLFDYLVGLDPEDLESYVTARLQSLPTRVGAIRDLAVARLIEDLEPGLEGSPDLRIPTLLAP